MKRTTKPKQVSIERDGKKVKVDKALAPLLLAMWGRGIDTTADSRQEIEPGRAWIVFPTVKDVVEFLNHVAVFPAKDDLPFAETLYGRITRSGSERDWEYVVEPVDVIKKTTWGPAEFVFVIGIYIPCDDLPVVLQLLKEDRPFMNQRRR